MASSKRTLERMYTTGAVEVRSLGTKQIIEGYAAIFDRPSQNLGGFTEVVRSTAFNKTIKEADVRALFNHDENLVLGRTRSGTLDLAVDQRGLYYRIDPPDTGYARDLLAMLDRRDVDQSSFAFFAIKDDWGLDGEDFPRRDLLDVALVDVSPVTFPAYLDTTSSSGGRAAAIAGLARRSGLTLDYFDEPDSIKSYLLSVRAVSDADWSQFSQADYTIEQWRRACLIGPPEQTDSKGDYKLPVREPNGNINRNACHAAAGRINQVEGVSPDEKRAAARRLVAIYRNDLKEDPPESLLAMAGEGGRSLDIETPTPEPENTTRDAGIPEWQVAARETIARFQAIQAVKPPFKRG